MRGSVLNIGDVQLDSGEIIKQVHVAFEAAGTLNTDKSNAILVCHALTGDTHAVGDDETPGWWEGLIGVNNFVDTEKYFVITTNVLGGCYGTTGPASINPETNKPYGSTFPIVTIRDMVRVQKMLIDHLGIEHLFAVIGGSMGGMQVYEWGVTYPDKMENLIPIATSAYLSAISIAYNDVGRQAIIHDPEWRNGDYYPGPGPIKGLSVARMLGMITYRTADLFEQRFGRRLSNGEDYIHRDATFHIESYLRYQGQKLVERFDANSYLTLLKAMDTHDISRGRESLWAALSQIKARVLSISISEDLLYPTKHQQEMAEILEKVGVESRFYDIPSIYGHDAFLVEFSKIGPLVESFLMKTKAF